MASLRHAHDGLAKPPSAGPRPIVFAAPDGSSLNSLFVRFHHAAEASFRCAKHGGLRIAAGGKQIHRGPGPPSGNAAFVRLVAPVFTPLRYISSQVINAQFVRFEAHHRRRGGKAVIVTDTGLRFGKQLLVGLVLVIAAVLRRRPLVSPVVLALDFAA